MAPSRWRDACNVPAFLMIFIPTTTLASIVTLVVLSVRCNGGLAFDREGNILCPEGSDRGVMVIRMCASVVVMTIVAAILTLCAWYQWLKRRKQLELRRKAEGGWVVGDEGEVKFVFPPEVPPPYKILPPKDMAENLCLAA